MTFQPIRNTGVGIIAMVAIILLASVATTYAFNTIVGEIRLKDGDRMVIVDNTGAGSTFNVELSWRFDASECMLQTLNDLDMDGTAELNMVMDDGDFSGNPAHADVANVEAVLLSAIPGNDDCEIDPHKGEFITVSSVGATAAPGDGGGNGGGNGPPAPVVGATVHIVSAGGDIDSFEDQTSLTTVSTINVGESVVWTYNDTIDQSVHTVTEGPCPPCDPDVNPPAFDSFTTLGKLMDMIGETFEHTFNTAGTFNYFCQVHGDQMTGTVIVVNP